MIKLICLVETYEIKIGEIFEVKKEKWNDNSWLIYISSKEKHILKYYFDTLEDYREKRINKILENEND
jgi:hypothetical protein